MDHGDYLVMSSKPTAKARRPNVLRRNRGTVGLGSVDWQILDAVDWRHRRLECSGRTGTSALFLKGTCEPSLPAFTALAQKRRLDRPWSNLCVPETRRTAACSTRWSMPVMYCPEVIRQARLHDVPDFSIHGIQVKVRNVQCPVSPKSYIGWAKKVGYCTFSICSLNIDQFSQFFTSRLRKKFVTQWHARHTYYVATLPCKI